MHIETPAEGNGQGRMTTTADALYRLHTASDSISAKDLLPFMM
jgi:hypothetical protein